MIPSTAIELADALSQADLLTEGQLARVAEELLPNLSDDPQEVAYALVQRGWLTSYQAELVPTCWPNCCRGGSRACSRSWRR